MFALVCAAGIFLLVLAARRIFIGPEEGGLFTLCGILFFLISMTMVGVGLIGAYMGRTYQLYAPIHSTTSGSAGDAGGEEHEGPDAVLVFARKDRSRGLG